MERAIWLTYDLGVKGDYQNLYAWLDDHKAIECGNNLAFFKYKAESKDDTALMEQLRKDLQDKVNFLPGNRIYVMRRKEGKDGDVQSVGSFIIGKRKANPWEGYGQENDNAQEEG